MRSLAVILALLAATPGVHHTPAGMAAARRALLRHADLGPGWSTGTTPKKVGTLACLSPTHLSGVVETGSAVSPTYRTGSSGPFVSSSAFVYRSAHGAAQFFREIAKPSALTCLALSLTSGSSNGGVIFTVRSRQVLSAPHVGVAAAAYRVVGRANVTAQKVTVYADVILLQRGATISQVSLASFVAPVRAAIEDRIARAAAARL